MDKLRSRASSKFGLNLTVADKKDLTIILLLLLLLASLSENFLGIYVNSLEQSDLDSINISRRVNLYQSNLPTQTVVVTP